MWLYCDPNSEAAKWSESIAFYWINKVFLAWAFHTGVKTPRWLGPGHDIDVGQNENQRVVTPLITPGDHGEQREGNDAQSPVAQIPQRCTVTG